MLPQSLAGPVLEWSSPSANSAGSMPLGNGDISINAWAEADGDLLLYLGKGDAWDENGRLLKLGRLRLHFSGQPFAAGAPFRQTLRADRGEIEITAGVASAELRLRLWVDAHRPVVRIEAESAQAFELETTLEVWRTAVRQLPLKEDSCPIGKRDAAELTPITPDTILDEAAAPGALAWLHRNERSVWATTLEHQDLAPLIPQLSDPLLGLTSGALVRGENLTRQNNTTLRSRAPGTRFTVSLHPLVAQTASAADWLAQVRTQADASDASALELARAAHREWWRAFWSRSHITVAGTPEAEKINQGYALQRFLTAAASRGKYPMKFNGSIFTVDGTRERVHGNDNTPEVYDADYRLWGGGYWFQNGRLVYWPMLLAGDGDLMAPFFRMYRDQLPLAEARTRLYYGHGGAFFPETMAFWGTFLNENYGYDRSGQTVTGSDVLASVRGEKTQSPRKPGDVGNTYIRRYWQGGLELIAMMLGYQAQTQDADFSRDTLLPLARAVLTFYREHHARRDEAGRLVLAPAQSLETWHHAVNPAPDIAGLRWAVDALLAMADLPEADRRAWAELRDLLPPLPTRVEFWNKKKYVVPAQEYDVLANFENPELYAVFPYRHYGVGKPELEVGRETYARRLYQVTGCWRQDAIHSALLGLTDEAARDVVKNFGAQHPNYRFPVFFGPNFDWLPDHDHGGAASAALQRMLLQADDGKIRLLPAWPKEWDVSFKLHAPQQTVVECVYRAGKIESLVVTPAARRQDVEVMA